MRYLLPLLLCFTLSSVQAAEAPPAVPGAITVDVFQAKRLHELGAVFVDVRPLNNWEWGHVDGALHLDLGTRFAGLADPQWPRDVPLVIYCDSEVCPAGAYASELAVRWGYKMVFYFREGYFAWMLADFPQSKQAYGMPRLSAGR